MTHLPETKAGGRWLKWNNFSTCDGWPNSAVARWDGSGYQEFGQDKFSETYWLNDHHWVEEEMRSFNEREYPMRLIIHHVNRPGRITELRKDSRQAKQLLKRYQKSKPYVAYGFELEPTVRVRLSHYEAGALMPSKEVTVRLPLKASYVNVVISNDNRHALYQVRISDREGHELFDIWVSNTDGSHLRELGYVRCKQDNGYAKEFYSLVWLPDNQQISFAYRNALYTLPVEDEEASNSHTLKNQQTVRFGGNAWRWERWRDDIEGEEYLKFFCDDRLVNTLTAEELGGTLIDAQYFRCPAPFPVLAVRAHTANGHGQTTRFYRVEQRRLKSMGDIQDECGGPLFRDYDGDGKPEWVFDDYDYYTYYDEGPLHLKVYKLTPQGNIKWWKNLRNPSRKRLPSTIDISWE